MRALPGCPFALLFEVPCPGCGLTRAALELFRGEFGHAFAHHPLVLVVLGVLAWLGVDLLLGRRWTRPTPIQRTRLRGPLLLGLSLALVAVWLLRFAGMWGGPVAV